MLPIFDSIVPEIHKRIPKKAQWIRDAPTDDDLQAVKEAGEGDSVFDPIGLRTSLFQDLQEGRAELMCRRLLGSVPAKVLVIVAKGQTPFLSWKLWANIFHAFGKCRNGNEWRIIFYCSSAKRTLPQKGESPGQKHVNGGYAYPNDPSSIVIYREEEATRVLVHELLHACGSDNMSNTEQMREVLTESWAEVFLIGVLANGSVQKAKHLWKIQSQWIVDQEHVLRNQYAVNSPSDYSWRYIVGRREVLERFGFRFPNPSANPRAAIEDSLRFTSPILQ
jgi:hypothetical protein